MKTFETVYGNVLARFDERDQVHIVLVIAHNSYLPPDSLYTLHCAPNRIFHEEAWRKKPSQIFVAYHLHQREDNADHVVAARGVVQLCSCVQNSSALPARFFGSQISKSNDTAPTFSFVIRSHPHNAASTMTRPQGSGHRGRLMKCLTRLNRRGISPYGTWPR